VYTLNIPSHISTVAMPASIDNDRVSSHADHVQYTHSISIFHATVRLFCSTQGHQLWHHQPTPTQPAHRAPSWNVYMNVTGNTGHIIVSVLLQWDVHVKIFIYSIIFYSIWFDLILFYFIICYPFICLYAHLVCPDFRKARLLTFSTTSNRSYTKGDEHTHASSLPTHASVIVFRRTCISITALRVWFFSVKSVSHHIAHPLA
jgi:hypothetical protein